MPTQCSQTEMDFGSSGGRMCGRRPRCKGFLAFCLRSGASHVSGLFARHVTAGPDEIRRSGPNQTSGFETQRPPRVLPIDGSTVSHQTIITLAIRLFALTAPHTPIAETLHARRERRRSIVSTSGQDRPGDARGLVG
jgi:hypothetical protein